MTQSVKYKLTNLWLPSNDSYMPKGRESMKQNGSLCSVIAGNLAEVSLATQTWFLTEDKERWCCCNAAATTLTSNSNSLDFVFSSILPSVSAGMIIVMQSSLFISQGHERSDENYKSEMFLVFTLKLWGRKGLYLNCFSYLFSSRGRFL